jgi:hypothetical protein
MVADTGYRGSLNVGDRPDGAPTSTHLARYSCSYWQGPLNQCLAGHAMTGAGARHVQGRLTEARTFRPRLWRTLGGP